MNTKKYISMEPLKGHGDKKKKNEMGGKNIFKCFYVPRNFTFARKESFSGELARERKSVDIFFSFSSHIFSITMFLLWLYIYNGQNVK